MTEEIFVQNLFYRFSLLKNKDFEYVAKDFETIRNCMMITIEELYKLSSLSQNPYYSIEYYNKAKILTDQICKS
jgi:hypothetical protein